MAQIKPFKAVLYNQDKLDDLAKVVCPPYDVISGKEKNSYRRLSPYNIVRLILGKGNRKDGYRAVEKDFKSWLDKKILCPDTQEAIYFYEQDYFYLGERKRRKGFISLLKIEDSKTSIHGHEHTHLAPREDRFQLIRRVKANLSPIFVLFRDKNHLLRRIWDKYNQNPCLIDIKTNSVRHRLWRIIDAKIIGQIKKDLESQDTFIADGHHRYEVACNFKAEVHKALSGTRKELSCDYIMSYFTDLCSRDLTVLPTHRVITGINDTVFNKFSDQLDRYFDISKAKDQAELFIMLKKAGKNEYALGMYKQKTFLSKIRRSSDNVNGFFLLRLKSGVNIDEIIDGSKPKKYKKLPVVVLNQLILCKMLKLKINSDSSNSRQEKRLFYTDDAKLAVSMVDNQEARIAFFLNPVDVGEMADLAVEGVRMPPKSTFFYPKLLTGLMINKF